MCATMSVYMLENVSLYTNYKCSNNCRLYRDTMPLRTGEASGLDSNVILIRDVTHCEGSHYNSSFIAMRVLCIPTALEHVR